MAEICRLCASFKTIDLLVPLFDAVQSIPAKVEQCCRVNVSADDREMPQNVCKGCLDALNKSYTFAETVTMAQNTLRKAIASHTISVSSTTPTTPVPQSTTFNRAVIWDQRKDDEIENDLTLKLQAMKMYLEQLSIDEIGRNLGVSKVIVEKWINALSMQQSPDSNGEMIYEIFDDPSDSDDGNEIKKSMCENGSLATLRWSESSESDETRSLMNDVDNEHSIKNRLIANDTKTDDTIEDRHITNDTSDTNILIPIMTRQLRNEHKRSDLTRWKDVPCRCSTCKEKFVGVDNLRFHVRAAAFNVQHLDANSESKHYGCGLCFKIFNAFGKLIIHSISSHVPHLSLSCFICEEEFSEKRLLNLHINSHYCSEKNFPCTYCDRSYTIQWNLRRHQLKEHPEILKKLMCKNCNETFTNAQILAEHVAAHTVKKNEKICGVCGYTTNRMHLYLNHMTSHKHSHDISETSALFKCNLCGKKLKSKRLHQIHIGKHRRNSESGLKGKKMVNII